MILTEFRFPTNLTTFHNVSAAKALYTEYTEKALHHIYLNTQGILHRCPENLSCLVGFVSDNILYK